MRRGLMMALGLVAGCSLDSAVVTPSQGPDSAIDASAAAADAVSGDGAIADAQLTDAAVVADLDAEPVEQPSCWTLPTYSASRNDHKYRIAFGESVRAYQAHEACLAEGAYLLVIDDQAEDLYFNAFTGYGRIFLGAFDKHSEGNFRWLTDSTDFWLGGQGGAAAPGRYQNFKAGEPNNAGGEDCVDKVELDDGKWNDQECDTFDGDGIHGYVCECQSGLTFTQPDWLPALP